ncbi:hypothetical protein TcWFU_005258 [Taenia crassiceps]|uniref:Active regulator of SIRT1 n=1 Tax=Taenia crassiceps TaxID=6207 RepID=A0ABR4QDW9_9CEST
MNTADFVLIIQLVAPGFFDRCLVVSSSRLQSAVNFLNNFLWWSMSLKNALRELSLPLDVEETTAKKTKTLKKEVDGRKYGQVRLQRNQRHKHKSRKNKSWKQFASSTGLKAQKKHNSKDVTKLTVEPRKNLVDLGKLILRSRRKLLAPEPPPPVRRKPKSLFQEKDFKELGQDLRTLFCS